MYSNNYSQSIIYLLLIVNLDSKSKNYSFLIHFQGITLRTNLEDF